MIEYGYFLNGRLGMCLTLHTHIAKQPEPVPELRVSLLHMRRRVQYGNKVTPLTLYNMDPQTFQGRLVHGPHVQKY